ncbi:MAG TPA: hypothetical protein VF167_00525 [Longimicrobiaceae bacterium]
MHIVLTDVLACPRCGPEFGLVILADRIEDRRVIEGWLGCANCREQYPVRGGVADLRWGFEPEGTDSSCVEEAEEQVAGGIAEGGDFAEGRDPEKPLRMAALLGLTAPSPPVAVVSDDPALVKEIQELLPDSAVVGVSREVPDNVEAVRTGWLLAGARLPFRSRSLAGVVLTAGATSERVSEALRCLVREARLVIEPAPGGAAEMIRREGARLLLEQDRVAVASDPRAG